MSMFLSVIIPCHNCKNSIKRVLNSIVIQDTTDVEIIIADDHSTDGFMDIVNSYKEILNIVYCPVGEHKYHCPGNTRHDGMQVAKGDWITFIDHDDEFYPNTFAIIKKVVSDNPGNTLIFSPVEKVTMDGVQERILSEPTWLHGNFYNRAWLEENNIDFKIDLFGNEDLYFNNQVYSTLQGLDKSYITVQSPLYKWYSNPESLSSTAIADTDCTYTEKYFGDYLIANSEPYFKALDRFPEQKDYLTLQLFQSLRFMYIYYERALFLYKDKKVLNEMLEAAKTTFNEIKEKLKLSTEDVIKIIKQDANQYCVDRKIVCELSGPYIETHSLENFFKSLK